MSEPRYYIFGLQRSGTNFLTQFLKVNYDIHIINNDTLDREKPDHKHFRIYDNKKIIPIPEYINDLVIKDFDHLKDLLKEPNMKVIIVHKDIYSWLVSIENWAKKCNWSKKPKLSYIDDYIQFYIKWKEMKCKDIIFVNYHKIIENDKTMEEEIANFLGRTYRNIGIKKVRQSKTFDSMRNKYYVDKKYMKEFSEKEIEFIQQKLSDASFSFPSQ